MALIRNAEGFFVYQTGRTGRGHVANSNSPYISVPLDYTGFTLYQTNRYSRGHQPHVYVPPDPVVAGDSLLLFNSAGITFLHLGML